MKLLLTYSDIDPQQWQSLVDSSPYATWFQTPEAYRFYAANAEEMMPFAIGVAEEAKGTMDEVKGERLKAKGAEDSAADNQAPTPYTLHSTPTETSRLIASSPYRLKAVCVGYITRERSALKQFFTRRAIIIGGPLLAEDATDAEVAALLKVVKECKAESLKCKGTEGEVKGERLEVKGEENGKADTPASTPYTLHSIPTEASTPYTLHPTPIYIETRNFHDYSRWRHVFEQCGFAYQPHLNFHVDCTKENILANMSESRRRQIKKALKNGVVMVEATSEDHIRDFYLILEDLYRNKVKTPLFPLSFFLAFYHQHCGKYLLVKFEDKIIGGIMCPILEGNTIYEWFVCGLDDAYKNQYPSVMATYAAIEYASTHRIALFDFMGAGKPDEAYGVRDFKARFGGEQVEHGRYLCVCKPIMYYMGKIGVKLLKKR